jgi:glutamate synthase domain-containing protein 3
LRSLIESHLRHTGSARAAGLLEGWHEAAAWFWRVVPRTDVVLASEAAEAALL